MAVACPQVAELLEHTTLIVAALVCLAARRAGVNEVVLLVAWLLVASTLRWARNRGALARWVAQWQRPGVPQHRP
ncbi:hypothetical protein [Actinoplanes sp. TFC3]|uniref:hypothetical protein n=1 Tax=Actinoplanes sp. TFC3 TaxID=1710355 RepID=UPI00082A4B03|nr:hypothetical protein [Actinoplanes sp. TFC3]